MNLIGGIVGGMIGFTLLGPIGALVGSVMGSRMTRQAKLRLSNIKTEEITQVLRGKSKWIKH